MEVTQPVGGTRIAKMQSLNIDCENLQYLELFCCKQLAFLNDNIHLPQLKNLRLLMLPKLPNNGLATLLSNSPKLASLFLMDLQSLSSLDIPQKCQQLHIVEMYECKAVSTVNISSNSLENLTLSDGRGINQLRLADPVHGFANLQTLRILGCPKLPLDFLYPLRIKRLTRLELISNAPSAKAYMSIEEEGFDKFATNNCNHLIEVSLDKIHNISLNSAMTLINQSSATLTRVIFDLTCVEKPKLREALRFCPNLKDWKVEKWYIKKKWTEW